MRFHKSMLGALAFLALSSGAAFAQERPPRADAIDKIQIETVVSQGEGDVLTLGGPNTFVFVNSEMSFERKTVKGAPYSAEATTETIQTLGDGNRIVRKNSATIFRDSEGRTRREQTLNSIGPWTPAGDPHKTIIINDPVGRVNYILDPKNQTARKMNIPQLAPNGTYTRVIPPGAQVNGSGPANGVRVLDNTVPTTERVQRQQPKVESLGKQVIEGVEAEGTRTTVSIPAGKIGNERQIDIVTERWYSPDLQVVVYSKRTDPMAGETIYRLTNINRDEPTRSLFEVPAGYKIKEGPEVFINRDFNFKYQEERKAQQ